MYIWQQFNFYFYLIQSVSFQLLVYELSVKNSLIKSDEIYYYDMVTNNMIKYI